MPERISFLKDVSIKWWRADPGSLGAALAYYTIFALAPLLLILIAVTGLFLSPDFVQGRLVLYVQYVAGGHVASVFQLLINQIRETHTNIIAASLGIVSMFVGTLGVLSQLQESINKIWNPNYTEKSTLHLFFRKKILAIVTVVCVSVVIILMFVVSAFAAFITQEFSARIPQIYVFVTIANIIGSFVFISIACTLAYKYLPRVHVHWRAALTGGLVAGILFMIGRVVIDLYLGFSFVTSTYGAAGTLIVVLMWVYYSSQIFFYSAAIAKVRDERLS
jgi:membrane protein